VSLVGRINFLNFGRLEKLNMRSTAGKAKVVGTIIGIGGSMLLTFFKGQEIDVKSFHTALLHKNNHSLTLHNTDSSHRFLGALCGFGSCFSFALWLIIQVHIRIFPYIYIWKLWVWFHILLKQSKINKEYPSHHSSTALMSLMAAIQATAFALYVEKDWNQWKLCSSIRILTVLYTV